MTQNPTLRRASSASWLNRTTRVVFCLGDNAMQGPRVLFLLSPGNPYPEMEADSQLISCLRSNVSAIQASSWPIPSALAVLRHHPEPRPNLPGPSEFPQPGPRGRAKGRASAGGDTPPPLTKDATAWIRFDIPIHESNYEGKKAMLCDRASTWTREAPPPHARDGRPVSESFPCS